LLAEDSVDAGGLKIAKLGLEPGILRMPVNSTGQRSKFFSGGECSLALSRMAEDAALMKSFLVEKHAPLKRARCANNANY